MLSHTDSHPIGGKRLLGCSEEAVYITPMLTPHIHIFRTCVPEQPPQGTSSPTRSAPSDCPSQDEDGRPVSPNAKE